MEVIVGIGEYAVSNQTSAKLKTYALSSCVAVTAYCRMKKAAGMVHIALPNPPGEEDRVTRPAYYASTGIPLLIGQLCENYGCSKNELVINYFGGAASIRKDDYFSIGLKNIEAVNKALAGLRLHINRAEIGGGVSRTVEMHVATGEISVVTLPMTI